MKPIILTEEQKSKLIEMCNVLFPEYGEVQVLESYISTETDATGSSYLRWYHDGSNAIKLIEIHWFEFVITELFRKVFPDEKGEMFGKPCFKSTSIEHYQIMIHWLAGYPKDYYGEKVDLETYHPVDYLYKAFKTKIK